MVEKIILASRHSGHATATPAIKKRLEEQNSEEKQYIVVTDYQDEYDYSFAEKTIRVPSFRDTGQKTIKPIKLLKNFYKSWRILKVGKPDKVVAYGANTSFPITYIAGKKGIPVIAVEAENRTKEPSKTPLKLSKNKNTTVWVSNDNLLDKYHTDKVENKEILQYRSFEEHQSSEKTNDLLVIPSSHDPELQEKYWKDITHEEFLDLMGKTKTVLTRGGMAAYEAANLAQKVLIRPAPHGQGHQKHFAKYLEKEYQNVEIIQDQTFQELIQQKEREEGN